MTTTTTEIEYIEVESELYFEQLDSMFSLRVVAEIGVFPSESSAHYRIELVCEEDGIKDIEVLETIQLEFLGLDKIKEHVRLFKKVLEKSKSRQVVRSKTP